MTTRRWVKLWHEILTDDDFHNLDMAQQGQYYTLLIYASAHGQKGTIRVVPPARTLTHLLQCEGYDVLKETLFNLKGALKNLRVTPLKSNGGFAVTFLKWHKYQTDDSTQRVQRFRRNVTVQEKEEEKRKIKSFDLFYKNYPNKKARRVALKAWMKLSPDQILTNKIISFVEKAKESDDWKKDEGQYIPHPSTFLNGRRWEDELKIKKDWRT